MQHSDAAENGSAMRAYLSDDLVFLAALLLILLIPNTFTYLSLRIGVRDELHTVHMHPSEATFVVGVLTIFVCVAYVVDSFCMKHVLLRCDAYWNEPVPSAEEPPAAPALPTVDKLYEKPKTSSDDALHKAVGARCRPPRERGMAWCARSGVA
jgi:hypothetical protein